MDETKALTERPKAVLYSRAAIADASVSEESRSVDVIVSTEDIDGHGTIVRQNWQLDRFASNPVVLYSHDSDELPIGTASKVGVVDGALRATITFSTADLNPKAEQVWQNVRAKVIRGISAGFCPHSYTCERQDDRDIMVLDDNELFEISVCPVPSNAQALAQMRSMAVKAPAPEPQPEAAPVAAAEPQLIPPPVAAEVNQPATREGVSTMSEANTDLTVVSRSLGLPMGSTVNDLLAAVTRLREVEVQVLTLTGADNSASAIGALRAMKEDSAKLSETKEKLAKVEDERDVQNFEALIQQGQSERKLTPAEVTFQRERFDADRKEGRGAARVEELRGYLKVRTPDARFARDVREPAASAGAGSPLTWNGKAYRDLTNVERARLGKENKELFAAMREDFNKGPVA